MVPSRALTTENAARGWRRLTIALAPALLLGLVAIWEVAVIARAGGDVASDDDWSRASTRLRASHESGDLIVFAPDWIDPVGRLHLGDLIPIDMAARMDGARYATIWELSIRGARAAETEGLEATSVDHFGALTMRRFEHEPAIVLSDFVAEFARARTQGSARVDLQEVGFAPHRCILARPRPNATVTVTFTDVELGSELVGYVGLADVFTRRDDRAPGRLDVWVAGKVAVTTTFGVDDGWVRFAARTTPSPRATVEFAATAVGANARKRLICFAAEARR